MIGNTALHTPEGIQELNGHVVETVTNMLGDLSWILLSSDNDPDMPSTTSTIGANRFDQPDILFGFAMSKEAVTPVENMVNDLYAWFEESNSIFHGKIDMKAFWEFRKARHGEEWKGSDEPGLADSIHLEIVDEERFLCGIGWHHRAYYAVNGIAPLTFLQLYIADTLGRFPWEKGYNSIQQYTHEIKPWGKAEKNMDKRPDYEPRMKYLH